MGRSRFDDAMVHMQASDSDILVMATLTTVIKVLNSEKFPCFMRKGHFTRYS